MDNVPQFFHLNNPCVLDVQTDVGLVSLMMDKEYAQYIFVSIEGELRKCIDISDFDSLKFDNDEQVFNYLQYFQDSYIFQELIDQEKEIEEGWQDL